MLARPYRFSDAKALDGIFKGQGITDPVHDEIFCVGNIGKPEGVVVYRPGAFVHELECGDGALRRLRGESLANYAIGHAKAKGLKTAIFLIRGGNQAMVRFVEGLGAVKQTEPGDLLYTLTP